MCLPIYTGVVNPFFWWFLSSSGLGTCEKLVMLCIFCLLLYTRMLTSERNMITMTEDLCGLLPAQTPVGPDQIKLFCSILNYTMRSEKKGKRRSSLWKGVYKGCEISGRPRGPLWQRWCQGTEVQPSTDEKRKLQGDGVFGPKAVTLRDAACLVRLHRAGQKLASAAEKGPGCLSAFLLRRLSTSLFQLLLAPPSSVKWAVVN